MHPWVCHYNLVLLKRCIPELQNDTSHGWGSFLAFPGVLQNPKSHPSPSAMPFTIKHYLGPYGLAKQM